MALSSFTTVLQRWTGAAYTTIAGVRDISGPSLELGTEDVTNHSSTSGYRQFVATVLGAGEVTFDLNFDPDEAQHGVPSGLIDDMRDKTLQAVQSRVSRFDGDGVAVHRLRRRL